MKRLFALAVTAACACPILDRIARVSQAARGGVTTYRIVEYARDENAGRLFPPSYDQQAWTPELHRYVIVAGCPMREVYRMPGYSVFWVAAGDDVRAYPGWGEAMNSLRERLGRGEPPDCFEPVERVK
jgi:hypothetical protein